MKKIIFCFLLIFSSYSYADQELPTPYCELKEVLPYNDHGWYINGPVMETLIRERKATKVIELGSWLGTSTRHIASLLPPNGMVYAVDHWMGSDDHFEYLDPVDFPEVYEVMPILYEQFLSNVIHAGLTNKIRPIRKTTLEAIHSIKAEGICPDIIYVDAAHDEESVYRDLVTYYPLVKGHGVLCGDDWGWGNGFPVMKAVERFAKENRLRIEVPNGWMWILYEK